ncbi:hypothetical protein G6F59_017860 [Rhizopus arrhizus]|nr:hypothetical protein G6F59_017860 [Rhizopus arrhizus]
MTSRSRQAQLQVALQQAILAERSIKSPFDGVVAERFAGPDQPLAGEGGRPRRPVRADQGRRECRGHGEPGHQRQAAAGQGVAHRPGHGRG